MMAVQFNRESCVTLLLRRGADPNLSDVSGNTALHLAVLFCDVSVVQQLLRRHARLDAENKEGFTPLSLAVSKGQAEIAEFLRKKAAGNQDRREPAFSFVPERVMGKRLLLRASSPSDQVAASEAQEEEAAEPAGDPDEVFILNSPLWREAFGSTLDAAAVERGAEEETCKEGLRSSEEKVTSEDENASAEQRGPKVWKVCVAQYRPDGNPLPDSQKDPKWTLHIKTTEQHSKPSSLPAVAAEKEKAVRFLLPSSSDSEKESYQEEENEEKQEERECSRKEERAAIPTSLSESVPAVGQQQRTQKRFPGTAAKASTGSLPAVAAQKKKAVRFLLPSSSDSERESSDEEEKQETQQWECSSEEERAAVPRIMKDPRIDVGHHDYQKPLKASTGSLPAVAAEYEKAVRFLLPSSSDSEKESSDEEEEQERECSSEEERTAVPMYFNESVPALGQQQRTKTRLQRTAAKASSGEHPASTFRVSSPAEKGGLKDGTEKSGVQEPWPQLQRGSSQLPLLHQVLEDVQEQQLIQGRAVPVALGWLHTINQKLTAATEKYVYLVEERNKNWKAQCAALRKQVLNYKTERGKREDTVRQLQQEVAAAVKKLSVAEGSLEESTRRCRTLQEANLGLRKELGEAEEKDTVRQLQQELAAALKKLSVAEGSLEESTRRCRTLEEANLGLRKELREAEDKDTVRQLQQELAAALKKLSVAEGSLEESTRHCRTLEEANLGLRKELRKAKTKCQELEKQQFHYEHHIQYWMSTLKDRDRELKNKSQKVQDLLSFSLETRARVKQLEQRVQCLSMQNIRLEGTVKQQSSWIEALRGDVEASASKRAEEMPATSFTVPSDCGGHFEHWCWV